MITWAPLTQSPDLTCQPERRRRLLRVAVFEPEAASTPRGLLQLHRGQRTREVLDRAVLLTVLGSSSQVALAERAALGVLP